jgi:hypothetical protein
MFGSVVTVVFQSVFRSKIHQNYFKKKIIFDIYTLKRLKNIEKKLRKKKQIFGKQETQFQPRSQTHTKKEVTWKIKVKKKVTLAAALPDDL